MRENRVGVVPEATARKPIVFVEARARILARRAQEQALLPLSDVPMGEARKQAITEDVVDVADHEFRGHAWPAYREGVSVTRVSVRRKPGEYEGVTVIGGVKDLQKMQVVAAGGVVHGRGFGSDLAKVVMIRRYFNGMKPHEAVARARGHASEFTPDEKRVAGEVVAYKGEILGSDIPLVGERARQEAQLLRRRQDPNEEMAEEMQEVLEEQHEAIPTQLPRQADVFVPDEIEKAA